VNRRIDDIEILRACAVLLVVVEHMQINLLRWGTPALKQFYHYFSGWTGVDLFFVIPVFRDLRLRDRAGPGAAT